LEIPELFSWWIFQQTILVKESIEVQLKLHSKLHNKLQVGLKRSYPLVMKPKKIFIDVNDFSVRTFSLFGAFFPMFGTYR
jgi:hypothetical protein